MQSLHWIVIFVVALVEESRDLVRGAQLKVLWMLLSFVLLIRVRVASLILFFEGLTPSDSHSVADIAHFLATFSLTIVGLMEPPASAKMVGAQGAQQYGMFVDNQGEDASKPKPKDHEAWHGELTASWMSRITFHWLTPLLMLGWKRQVNDEDLCPLLPEDTMAYCGKRLLQAWNIELERKRAEPKRAPLFRSLFAVHWRSLLLGAVFKTINDLVVFVGPMLLQQLIRFVEKGGEDRSMVDGVFIALGMFLAKTVESVALNQYFHVGYRLGSEARAAVTALIYRKAFVLSAKGRQDFKLGELVSLMSVDAQRLCNTAPYLHQFWSSPMQLVVSVALLYNTVRPPPAPASARPRACWATTSSTAF